MKGGREELATGASPRRLGELGMGVLAMDDPGGLEGWGTWSALLVLAVLGVVWFLMARGSDQRPHH